MVRKFFVVLILMSSLNAYSQDSKRDNIWMLGGALPPGGHPEFGIDFSNGTADTFSVVRPMGFFATNASICDTNGQLLFYTNGNYVANRFHQMMPGTAGFNPGDENNATYPYGSGAHQGALILPWPDSYNKYALIHLSGDNFVIGSNAFERPLSIRFSVINMDLDSGRGDFETKNQILISDTLVIGRISACRHANGRDWWILCHELWSNSFYEFLLTPDTLEFYSTQDIGFSISHRMDALGTGVFSPDGAFFAYQNWDTTLNIFSFDRCTGLLSNPVYLYLSDTLNTSGISCAFSPNSRYLYISNPYHIFQLDMFASNIDSSKIIIATYDGYDVMGFRTTFANLRLAPDNKIYITTYDGTNVLHVINNPDNAGLACNLTQHSFVLPYYNVFALPNAPDFNLGSEPGCVCDSLTSGIENIGINNTLLLYPVPVSNSFSIELPVNGKQIRFVDVSVYNILGELMLTKHVNAESMVRDISISNFRNGIYFCKVVVNNETTYSSKFEVSH
jgi:hypothetical protein